MLQHRVLCSARGQVCAWCLPATFSSRFCVAHSTALRRNAVPVVAHLAQSSAETQSACAVAAMEVDHSEAALDRAFDVLERCRDVGIALPQQHDGGDTVSDEAALLAAPEASPLLRSVAAAIAERLSAAPWRSLAEGGYCHQDVTADVQAACEGVRAVCAAGGAGLAHACERLLAAVDADGAAHVGALGDTVEVLGASTACAVCCSVR
jgi:hypothetical protein